MREGAYVSLSDCCRRPPPRLGVLARPAATMDMLGAVLLDAFARCQSATQTVDPDLASKLEAAKALHRSRKRFSSERNGRVLSYLSRRGWRKPKRR